MGGGGSSDLLQYVLGLEQFHVTNTRSNDKDTDVVAFTASVGGLVYPTQIKRMENIQDGDHFVGFEIGPILASPDAPVNIGYTIVNSGYDASDTNAARQVTDTLSTIAAGICTGAFGGGAVWDQLNQLTHGLNKLIFANCDGPVAGDGIFVAIDILKQWTSNGTFVQRPTYKGTGSAPIPCHGDSNYTVTWWVAQKTDALDLAGVSSDGSMWRAIRQNDGTWQPFSDVKSQVGNNPGTFVDVSNAGSLDDGLHLCGITADGGIWHTLRNEIGHWSGFGDVKSQTSNPGAFSRVGIATVFGELQVCGITPSDGNIWHAIRHIDGSWQPFFGNVKAKTSNPGTFVDVSGAGVVGELHVCGITLDGGIWHTIRHVDGSWQPFFGDVKSQTSNPGAFSRVGIASVSNELQVCGITLDGGIWHTIRHIDGTWQPFFGDVKSQAGSPGAFVDIGVAGVNGELHLCGLDSNGGIWHTIRHADGTWTPFDNVMAEAGNPASFLAVSGTELFSTSTEAVIT